MPFPALLSRIPQSANVHQTAPDAIDQLKRGLKGLFRRKKKQPHPSGTESSASAQTPTQTQTSAPTPTKPVEPAPATAPATTADPAAKETMSAPAGM